MRLCTVCNLEKDISDFYKNTGKRDGLNNRCKTCWREYMKSYYKKNEEKLYPIRKQQAAVYLKGLMDKADKIKADQGCYFCQEKEPICLDFHHTDPTTKDNNVSELIRKKNWKKVLAEIEKCVIVCSNCHRKLHAGLLSLEN